MTPEMRLMTLAAAVFAFVFVAGIWVGSEFTLKPHVEGCPSIPGQIGQLEQENGIDGSTASEYVFCTNQNCFKASRPWGMAGHAEPEGVALTKPSPGVVPSP